MADIFLSYSRTDRDQAAQIAQSLEAEGLSVWWDNALRAGQTYDEVTEGKLRDAAVIVVLWSKQSVKSKWVRAEATLGERTSAIVPAMIEEADRPIMFELIQTADLIGWHGEVSDPRWQQFVDDIKLSISRTKTVDKPVKVTNSGDDTIEATFWNSVKEGEDINDLIAYLKRYPEGHFVDLAKNRIKLIEAKRATQKAKAVKPKPVAAPKAKTVVKEGASATPTRKQNTTPPSPTPTPRQAPPPSSARHTQQKPAMLMPILVGGIILVVAMIGVFAWKNSLSSLSTSTKLAATETVETQEDWSKDKIEDASETTPEATSLENSGNNPQKEHIVESNDTMSLSINPDLVPQVTELAEIGAEATDEMSPEMTEDESQSIVEEDADRVNASLSEGALTPASSPTEIQDCDTCPKMIILSSGSFLMGSPAEESGRVGNEGPQKEITLPAYAIAKTEVTFDQWSACVNDGGCNGFMPSDKGYGKGSQPVIGVSWTDASAYIDWLNDKTGRLYRLPSEAEWEHAARAGTKTRYWWGESFDRQIIPTGRPKAVTELEENPFGLTGMLGNAREWVADCYENNYANYNDTGKANKNRGCDMRVLRGGNWKKGADAHRAANRARYFPSVRDSSVGFRVVTSDLEEKNQ
ncbi:MAG: SUMF1/EgtB/PvdO family nonheme iron enzyme [bacterium]